MDDELDAVTADRITALEARLAALEARWDDVAATADGPGPEDTDVFWALSGLKERVGDSSVVLFTGSVTLPTGEHVEWQEAVGTASMLQADPVGAVAALSALAHPVRLQLVHKVLHGRRTVPELSEGLGTTGQLYHHLRQLVAEGWLATSGRGRYEVPPTRVVPLLTLLATVGLR